MDNNEVIIQPEIAGSVDVKIGKVTKMNFLCPEDDPTTTGDGKIDSPFNDFIQNLKCCGNCSHYECLSSAKYTHMCCLLTNETAIHPNWACEEWEYDNISFDRRSC
jgi:hypothetical protein